MEQFYGNVKILRSTFFFNCNKFLRFHHSDDELEAKIPKVILTIPAASKNIVFSSKEIIKKLKMR